MSVIELVNEVIAYQESLMGNCDELEEALDEYYELVEKKMLIPRENQLLQECIEFKGNSNFY